MWKSRKFQNSRKNVENGQKPSKTTNLRYPQMHLRVFLDIQKKNLHLVEHRKVSVRGKFSHRFEHSRIFSHPQTFLFFRKNEFSAPRIFLIWLNCSGKIPITFVLPYEKKIQKKFSRNFSRIFRKQNFFTIFS